MALENGTLTTKVDSGSPYQLDMAQVNRATSALVKHISEHRRKQEASATKQNLLAANSSESEDDAGEEDDTAIWLTITTKKHISDTKRLKPGKITLPHSLHASSSARVCLITADPQRTVKDIVTDPSFPPVLAQRISRVIGLSKLKSRYKSYESRRQLLSEHDVFLADDRIITFLPTLLGKIFYRGGSKRPVPVNLTVGAPRDASQKKDKSIPKNPLPPRKTGPREGKLAGGPAQVAREIERALTSALVHISPSTTTSVKVGRGRWSPEKIAANVEVVVMGITEKYVPRGWRNVRSIHIKGNETAALPIWLASELWEDEADVLEKVKEKETVQSINKKKNKKRKERKEQSDKKRQQQQQQNGKRKAIDDGKSVSAADDGKERSKKQRKSRESDGMAAISTKRKERLQKLKDKVMA